MSAPSHVTRAELLEAAFRKVWTTIGEGLAPLEMTSAAIEGALPLYVDGEMIVSIDKASIAQLDTGIEILIEEVQDAAEHLKALVYLYSYRLLDGAGFDDPALPSRPPPDTG